MDTVIPTALHNTYSSLGSFARNVAVEIYICDVYVVLWYLGLNLVEDISAYYLLVVAVNTVLIKI